MSSKLRKLKDTDNPSVKHGKNRNYWMPLQALEDEDIDTEHVESAQSITPPKVVLPPIKVLVKDSDYIKKLLISKGISDFFLKKISIGIKIIGESNESFNKIKEVLKENSCQFFTHDLKNERSFSAVLHGLENRTTVEVKNELISLGFKCKEVKMVTKTYENYKDTLYVIHFERGSVKLHDLKRQVKSLFRVIVRWDFQRKIKNKIIQCRNCQMYGHGERGCFVKTNCANCAGKHKTSDCTNADRVRCANCNNNHKSNDPTCPNRVMYLQIKEKYNRSSAPHPQPLQRAHTQAKLDLSHSQFPPLSGEQLTSAAGTTTKPQNWRPLNSSIAEHACKNNLFTEKEITELTFELVLKLKECKTKHEQFNTIAQLAIKFLYSTHK